MSIAESAQRLARLAASVADLQRFLKDWHRGLDAVDRDIAALLGPSSRTVDINVALGRAEHCLQDLNAVLDQVSDKIRAIADHHLGNQVTGPRADRRDLRAGLPPDLPSTKDRLRRRPSAKTHGRWSGSDGRVREEISGWDDKYHAAVRWFKDQPGARVPMAAADVEVKVAVHMRDNEIREVTLAINNIPCVGEWGCDTLVPRILPRGYTLTVHGSGGFRAVYHGEASP